MPDRRLDRISQAFPQDTAIGTIGELEGLAYGRFAATQRFSRFLSEADIQRNSFLTMPPAALRSLAEFPPEMQIRIECSSYAPTKDCPLRRI